MPSGYKFTSTSHVMTASQLLKFYRVIAAAFKGGTKTHDHGSARFELNGTTLLFQFFRGASQWRVIVTSWQSKTREFSGYRNAIHIIHSA